VKTTNLRCEGVQPRRVLFGARFDPDSPILRDEELAWSVRAGILTCDPVVHLPSDGSYITPWRDRPALARTGVRKFFAEDAEALSPDETDKSR